MKKQIVTIVLMLLCMVSSQAQNVVSVPYAESFENGLSGWTTVDGDGDNYGWRVVDFSSVPPSMAVVLGYFAYDGDRAAYSESVDDEGQPLHVSNWLVSPAMTLSATDTMLMSWWVKGRSGVGGDRYEVRIGVVSGTEVDTADFYDVVFSDTVVNTTYEQRTVKLSAYAGLQVRVAFHHIGGNSSLQLDYVVFGNDSLPIVSIQGPMGVDVADTSMYTASLVSGSTDGLYYEWICDEADYIGNYDGDTTFIVWTQGALSRVGVVATNAYGSDTAWLEVVVSDCGVIDSFPFVENFSEQSRTRVCWKMFDADGNGVAWRFDDGEARSSSITFFGLFPEQDNWLITPPLAMDDAIRQLSWQVKPSSDMRPAEHYSVLLATGGDVYDTAAYTELFSETLSDPYNWGTRYLSLAGYEGDTVRIAFRHHSTDDQEYLGLTNVRVDPALAPIVTLHAPADAIVGDAVAFGLDTFSALPITDITWTFWTDLFGNTQTITQTIGLPFSYTWPDGTAPGNYMVRVEVTNDEGTTADSVWLQLRVCEVDSVPYQHSFGSDEECWRIGQGWYVGDSMTVDGIDIPAAVSFSHDEFGNDLQADNTIATPWLYIPDNTYELRFLVAEVPPLFFDDTRMDRYSVVVRTATTADTVFTGVVSGDYPLEYRFPLGTYADSNIQVSFRHHDSPAGFGLRLAEVSVMPVAPPRVSINAPQRARIGENVTVAASVVSSEMLAYNWQMAGATPDTATGTPVNVHWDFPGTYSILLTVVSPLYGSFTDSASITIIDCNGNVELPYTESFNADMDCWSSYDLDGDGYGWEMSLGNSMIDRMFAQALAYGGVGNSVASWSTRPAGDLLSYILSAAGLPLQADNLIVSPAMSLPTEGSWQATLHIANIGSILIQTQEGVAGGLDSFAIMVTTVDGSSELSDYDELIPMRAADSVGYGTYTVDLDTYRGQTIRIAVRHRANALSGLLLDEVSIHAVTPQHTITVVSDNTAMGTVNGGGVYEEGATALITASAYNGYRFDHWHDGNTDNPRLVTVTADATYTAYFVSTTTQGISDAETESDVAVYSRDGHIVVVGADGLPVHVFDMVGRRVDGDTLPAGVYIVKIGNFTTRKVVVMR